MFIVVLRFGANKAKAPEFMDAHNAWIARGFDDGVFLLVGGLQPQQGGVFLAQATDRPALEAFIRQDPFVKHGIVEMDVLEVDPGRVDARLEFLKAA